MPDALELTLGLDPDNSDSDGDQVRDGREDADDDGLRLVDELLIGTDPTRADTDGDGLDDGTELARGCQPRVPDWVWFTGRTVALGGLLLTNVDVYLDDSYDTEARNTRSDTNGSFRFAELRSCPRPEFRLHAYYTTGGTNYSSHLTVTNFTEGITNLLVDLVLSPELAPVLPEPLLTFGRPVVTAVPGDFDGDGRLDLVTSVQASSVATLHLGRGDGQFGLTRTFRLGRTPADAAAGDVNGDGRLDLVSMESSFSTSADAVTVSFGRGSGAFDPPLRRDVGVQLEGLAVLRVGTGAGDSILMGTRANRAGYVVRYENGRLIPPQTLLDGGRTIYRGVADVNGDGRPDSLAVQRDRRALAVSVGLTNGLGPARITSFTERVKHFTAGDFDGDGRVDVVVQVSGQPGFYFARGNGDGTFQVPLAQTDEAALGDRLFAADFTGDGRLDFVSSTREPEGFTLRLFSGRGDGTFATSQVLGTGELLAAADFNGDGRADLVYGRDAGLGVALNQGNGRFRGLYGRTLPVQVADVNGDGRADVLTLTTNGVDVHAGAVGGGFATPNTLPNTAGATAFQLGDINGDGRSDLLLTFVAESGNRLVLRRALSGGSFGPEINLGEPASGFNRLLDLTGDGRADLVTAVANENNLTVRPGLTNGAFAEPQTLSIRYPIDLVTADLTGDGRPDLLVSSRAEFSDSAIGLAESWR